MSANQKTPLGFIILMSSRLLLQTHRLGIHDILFGPWNEVCVIDEQWTMVYSRQQHLNKDQNMYFNVWYIQQT